MKSLAAILGASVLLLVPGCGKRAADPAPEARLEKLEEQVSKLTAESEQRAQSLKKEKLAARLTSDAEEREKRAEPFAFLYGRVGRDLDRARLPASHALMKEYLDINYQAGMKNQAIRGKYTQQLLGIDKALDKLNKDRPPESDRPRDLGKDDRFNQMR